jgi:hypothetical protein
MRDQAFSYDEKLDLKVIHDVVAEEIKIINNKMVEEVASGHLFGQSNH